jgi:glutathione S-transferase
MLKLYHNDMSSCSQKVRFVLHEKGLEWDSELLDLRRGDQFEPKFRDINPKSLVPALVHDGATVVESNVIIEYLNEAFPTPHLLPVDALSRARVRAWMKRLDDGLHLEVIALSCAIAFRLQIIEACGSDAALEQHLASIRDPYIQQIQREVVTGGIESPRFEQAVRAFEQAFVELEEALALHDWMVGDQLTLADIAYAPYVTRLDHLHMQGVWDNKPHVASWYARLQATSGYQAGLGDWFNAKYLPLMDAAGVKAWPRVARIIERSRV